MPINISVANIGGGASGGAKRALEHRVVVSTTAQTAVVITTGKRYMAIENIGNKIVYVGKTGVTTTSYAMFITPKEHYEFGLVDGTFGFYILCASGCTSTLGVTEYA